jgi:hypothetical protein
MRKKKSGLGWVESSSGGTIFFDGGTNIYITLQIIRLDETTKVSSRGCNSKTNMGTNETKLLLGI